MLRVKQFWRNTFLQYIVPVDFLSFSRPITHCQVQRGTATGFFLAGTALGPPLGTSR
jgi:hypothetical protein